jgi:23S rRNA pseudouridine1911/1915/1917 synthase
MVARSARAYDALVEQLSERTVERLYIALAWGHFASPRGVIDAPIGRSESRRTRMAVRESGKPARTAYEVDRDFEQPVCSLVECRLETGRTHQIRVHLSAVGHPVVGDATYGGSRESIKVNRPFLHATTLGFDHPVTGERMSFTDPLPENLQAVLDDLDANA